MSPLEHTLQDFEPRSFPEFIGQDHIIRELKALLSVNSSKSILLRGNYGLGKTTLAKIYATYRGDWTYQPVPVAFSKLNKKAVSHIMDEIHLAPNYEKLYNEIEKNTFIFCTTEVENLPDSFVSRCIEFVLSNYSQEELIKIVHQYKERKQIPADDDTLKVIASRGKGTPRVALQLLDRVHALSVSEKFKLDAKTVGETLNSLKVYEGGMVTDDIVYMNILNKTKQPISLNTLSASMLRSKHYVSSFLEPHLLNLGYVLVTPRGRIITEDGIKFLEETNDVK